MPKRCILLLSTHGLDAYEADGSCIHLLDRFDANGEGHARFAAFLATHTRQSFAMLADIAEEGYQLEDIPFSTGKDRAAIIKRKLGQYFYGTPYALAHSEGRQKSGRRDERLLLMALPHPQHLEPWLTPLDVAQISLSGLYTLPQLLAALLPSEVPKQLLLITPTRSGLRQSFFDQRQLRLSRLTPLATDTAQETAVATALEAGKMHQYLSGQRLIERGRPLAVRVICPADQVGLLHERCHDIPALHFEIIDLAAETVRLGLKPGQSQPSVDALCCHLLAHKPPAEQFALPAQRRFYRLWQVRYGLKVAAALLLASGLLFAARQFFDTAVLRTQIDVLEQQTRLDQERYDATLQALPKIPISVEQLRAIVDRFDAEKKRAVGPRPLLAQLSQSLDSFPDISLDLLEWRIIEKVGADGTATNGTTAPSAPAPAAALVFGMAPANLGAGPFAQLHVEARLPLDMASQQGAQIDRVTTFFKHLAQAPDSSIAVLQMPVDTQSSTVLRSDEERSTPEAPRFSFLLIRKL